MKKSTPNIKNKPLAQHKRRIDKKRLCGCAQCTIVVFGVGALMGCNNLSAIDLFDRHGANEPPPAPAIVDVSAFMPKATTTIACDSIQPQAVITISGHTQLSPNCDLTGQSVRFIIDSSDSSLNCQGAQLSPAPSDSSSASYNHSAITIRPNRNADIHGISVANCHITGYGHALHIRQFHDANVRYTQGLTTQAANKDTAPHDIDITNLSSTRSKNSGIFVGDHAYDVRFSRLNIQSSGTVGVYFEFGSQHNLITNSIFADNGFRRFKPNREAIAIDASANNVIQNNHFIHNGAGGIMLYRNCFEHANDPTRSNHFKRTQSSENNLIQGNLFENEPVGIWVASRQSRNLKGFECGAYPLLETANARYHLDSARDNQIMNNHFVNVEKSIIVEDDGTLIQENDFTQAAPQPAQTATAPASQSINRAIVVGSAIREQSKAGAIKHTRILDNRFANSQQQDVYIRPASLPFTTLD